MDNNTITKIAWDKCSGCCLCQNICPTGAICMQENHQGFIHPVIDEAKCINCGKCLERCPVREPIFNNSENPECRAIWANDDIRMNAASGGVFSAFAEVILSRGGTVCGAVYDENFNVVHILAHDIEGLNKIKSSKYIQSTAGYIYKKVKKELDDRKEVLFSGCPCQVAAMYSYLENKEYDNLYTMDLICHGVPSPKALRKYLEEYYKDREIENIDFRDKSHYGWSTEMNIYFKDGSVFREHHSKDSFYRAFLPCLSIRKSCGSCAFSHIPRQGDVSIGDFWGIASYKKELNDKKGTSLVLINNSKGEKIIRDCKHLWIKNEVVPIEEGLRINKTIEEPFRSHPARDRFFAYIDKRPFKENVDKCLAHHYDIGIVGLWYGLNYGSILTYYALYEIVNSMGHDAIMVNKPKELWNDKYSDRNTIANRFIYDHCNVSNIRGTLQDWREMNDHCDTFIVGSDVVWNYKICGSESKQFFFLDWVKDDKKKIAMASSFGSGYDAPPNEHALSEYYIKKFDYIGVREKEGVGICEEQFGVRADQIMDPVFLCKRETFDILADSVQNGDNGQFVTSYILGPDHTKRSILERSANILEVSLRNLPNPNNPHRFTEVTGLESISNPSVEEWLYYVKNARFFVGDSFHGLCFSLIFNVPFFIILNTNVAGLSRFTTLLKLVDLEDRMMFTNKDSFDDKEYIITKEIDFDRVNSILSIKSDESRMWLEEALKGPKKYRPTAESMLIEYLKEKVFRLEKVINKD